MTRFFRQGAVIARRDFRAVVKTPTFLLFLLAPVFMLLFGWLGGSGASRVAEGASHLSRIAIIAAPDQAEMIMAADQRMREYGDAPRLVVVAAEADPAEQARAMIESTQADTLAVLFGPLSEPTIQHEAQSRQAALWLQGVADQTLLAQRRGPPDTLSRPVFQPLKAQRAGIGLQRQTGYVAVVTVFMLTLLLAGQAVGMLAEEKSNKVIEILAAAAPLEAVFLGKLVGMFGVALLFVAFWGGMLGGMMIFVPGTGAEFAALAPAIGLPAFLILAALYFTMAYMLLGAVFLGIGGLAATVRDIQMLSFPVTILQMGMFGLATVAAGQPDSPMGRFAEVFPLSSPYAMAARGAHDPSLWPHLIALTWQTFWVIIIIWIAARVFRHGVLKSGGGLLGLFGRKAD